MDIRKIAMYLAGKLPPYYGESNLWSYSRALRGYAKELFTEDELKLIQHQAKDDDEQFYFMTLSEGWKEATDTQEDGKKSKDDLINLLQNDLEIPNQVIGIDEKITKKNKEPYTWDHYTALLEKRYGTTEQDTKQKGELFEELCRDILIIK